MHPPACQRFRRLATLAVDGELPELDAVALAQHLDRCPSCRSFAAAVDTATREIRDAELETYHVQWSPVPRRRSVDGLIRRAVTLAGVASIAGVVGATVQALGSAPPTPQDSPVLVIDASGTDTTRETTSFIRGLKNAALVREVGAPDPAASDRPGARAN